MSVLTPATSVKMNSAPAHLLIVEPVMKTMAPWRVFVRRIRRLTIILPNDLMMVVLAYCSAAQTPLKRL